MFGFLGNIWSYATFSAENFILVALATFVSGLMLTIFLAPEFLLKSRFASIMWGRFENKFELKKFGFLAGIFGIIIGTYWALRPIKDSIFTSMIGFKAYQPYAKILSLFLIVPLIILYNKLIDKYPRHKLFYILCTAYGVIALLFMFAFLNPTIGLANTVQSPWRIIGWLWYVYIESFGSMIVALFWAFTSDITKPGAAKRGFPLIALLGQMGNIIGPKVFRATSFGFENSGPLVGILAAFMFSLAILMWLFMKVTPKSQMEGFESEVKEEADFKKAKEKGGFLDGLKHLLKHKYLMGIAAIIIFFEVIVTILDYIFKALAQANFTIGGVLLEKNLAAYLGDYGFWTGIVATLCVLFGINNIQRRLGMQVSLVLMPIIVAIAVITLRINPVLGVAFWIMVFSKAVNYALNQPTLKQAYIPTSKESKYKAQSWIEMFGGRSSKAIGSGINTFGRISWPFFIVFSTVISLGLVGLWVFVAIFIGRTYTKAVKENKIVC